MNVEQTTPPEGGAIGEESGTPAATPKMVSQEIFDRRIGEKTRSERDAQRRAAAAEEEAERLRAELRALNPESPSAQPRPAATPQPSLDELVQRELSAREFNERCNRVAAEADKLSPKTSERFRELQESIGHFSPELVDEITREEEAPQLLVAISGDPELADKLLRGTAVQQGKILAALNLSIKDKRREKEIADAAAGSRRPNEPAAIPKVATVGGTKTYSDGDSRSRIADRVKNLRSR